MAARRLSRRATHALAIFVIALTGTSAGVEGCGSGAGHSVFDGAGGQDGSIGTQDGSIVIGQGDSQTIVIGNGDGGTTTSLDGSAVSLAFDPPSVTIVVDGTTTKTASLTLVATDAAGHQASVEAESLAFDRPDLATAADGVPVVVTAPSSATPYAGTGTVHAIFGGLEATAAVTVQVQMVAYGSGLSATSPAVVALNAAGDAGAAADASTDAGAALGLLPPDPKAGPLLYPYDGTVWPLGLTSPLLMWNAPGVGDVYRLHYAEKSYSYDGYFTLASVPAQQALDQTVWDRLTASNQAGTAPDPLTLVVSRWDAATGAAYTTATETWTIAPESLRGAIYYWTASEQSADAARVGHISRFQPGSGATPVPLNNGICMGCHAVNAQGTILVADVDDNLENGRPDGGGVPSVAPYDNWSGTRPWASFDVTQPGSPMLYQSNKFGADVALTPDGKYVVFGGPTSVAGSKYMSLGDPLTGDVIATSGLDQVVLDANETNLEMPAFSPDGTMLAVVESSNGGDPDNVIPNDPEIISYLTFDETGPTFAPTLHNIVASSADALTATGGGLGYPSFTPDSKAVAFHSGTYSTGCQTGCLDPDLDDGDLFIVTLDGGAPIRLAAADDPPDPNDRFDSVEPTFNPIVRGGYSWVVFTSMRNWGNHVWPSPASLPDDAGPDTHANAKRRLWVAAVDTTLGTIDPSHPAIYLEGQEDTPNMRGFWTLASCIPTPGASAGAGDAGSTSDAGADGGADDGAMCTNGFECCSGFCEQGVCVDTQTVSCVGIGGACGASAVCCNSDAVACMNGVCAIPPLPR